MSLNKKNNPHQPQNLTSKTDYFGTSFIRLHWQKSLLSMSINQPFPTIKEAIPTLQMQHRLSACSECTSIKLGLLHLLHHPLPTGDFIAPVITSNSHHQSSPVSVAVLQLGFNLQTDKHIWSIVDRLKNILSHGRPICEIVSAELFRQVDGFETSSVSGVPSLSFGWRCPRSLCGWYWLVLGTPKKINLGLQLMPQKSEHFLAKMFTKMKKSTEKIRCGSVTILGKNVNKQQQLKVVPNRAIPTKMTICTTLASPSHLKKRTTARSKVLGQGIPLVFRMVPPVCSLRNTIHFPPLLRRFFGTSI